MEKKVIEGERPRRCCSGGYLTLIFETPYRIRKEGKGLWRTT
jgi:hypothetical protein